MKKIIFILMMCSIVIVGCNNKTKNYTSTQVETKKGNIKSYYTQFPKKLDDNEYIICTIDNNQEIIKNMTMNTSFIFHILSKEELDNKKVKIGIDSKNQYKLIKVDSKKMDKKFDQSLCLLYNNTDWDKLKKLQMDESSSAQDELNSITSEMDSQYEKLEDEKFPTFFDNVFRVEFSMNEGFSKEELKEMHVTINDGKEQIVNIGKIVFNDEYKEKKTIENVCKFSEMGRMDCNIFPSKDGEIELSGYTISVDKDIVIKKIRLINKDKNVKLKEVNIDYEIDDDCINQKWNDKNELAVGKGEEVTLNFIINDKNFCNKMCYAANYYFEVDYEYKGQIYTIRTQTLCKTKYDAQTLYAIFKDKVDMIKYYCEYAS